MHLEAEIKKLRNALGGSNQTSIGMHSEVVIKWTQICTWRPKSSRFGDALGGPNQVKLRDAFGGRDGVGLKMHEEAMIDGDCMSTWKCPIWWQ
jgi:hypothetical protein